MNARTFLSALLAASVPVGCAAKHSDYGEPLKMKAGDTLAIVEILDNVDRYDGQYLRVSGTVASVCERKGCWLRLGEKQRDETVFVKFTCPVEGRLIPMEAVGRKAVVEGTLKTQEVSEDEARHMAEDQGKSTEEIAQIVGSQKRLQIFSPAARVEGI